MIEDKVIESAENGCLALPAKDCGEIQVEVFFSRHPPMLPMIYKEHSLGSARCGWVTIRDAVYCACVLVVDGAAIVRSSERLPLLDFIMNKDRISHKLAMAQEELVQQTLNALEMHLKKRR